jgi:pentatricopeptide repeat protein
MLGNDAEGDDLPPGSALMNTLLGRDESRARTLGEYDHDSYPMALRNLLARREDVARELLSIDTADADARVRAIPRLRELLRRYPHPLVYETLIHACLESGRFDEARGVAFAARQRRIECLASEFPEIRAEVDGLRAWDIAEIDGWGKPRSRRS